MSAAKSAPAKKRGLGRGLEALLGPKAAAEAPKLEATPTDTLRNLPVDALRPGKYQPRRAMDADKLTELSESIKSQGVIQPIVVRELPDRTYEIIAGERRWRAAQRAGLHEVPVIIREVDDKEALELAIIENVQRADLNPLEEAQGYGQLIEQFDYTQNDLAQVIGKSRSHVANTLRLLRLPTEVQTMLEHGELTAGHARTLITSDDPLALARRIVDAGLSVREAEALHQQGAEARRPQLGGEKRGSSKDADTLALEKQLSDALGLSVTLDHKDRGGKLEIRYKTLEQLDGICARLLPH